MSSTPASLHPARPRGLNLAAIRLGSLLVAWGRRRADHAARRADGSACAHTITSVTAPTPAQLRERVAAQHDARAALESARAQSHLHIR